MNQPLNTHGLAPASRPGWKVFVIDGWQLVVSLDSNDEGDGWGLKYATTVEGIDDAEISFWLGATSDPTPKMEAAFADIYDTMDEEGARKGLQMLLDHIGPTCRRILNLD